MVKIRQAPAPEPLNLAQRGLLYAPTKRARDADSAAIRNAEETADDGRIRRVRRAAPTRPRERAGRFVRRCARWLGEANDRPRRYAADRAGLASGDARRGVVGAPSLRRAGVSRT